MTTIEQKAEERIAYRTERCSIQGFSILIAERGGRELNRTQMRDEVIQDLFAGSSESQKREREAINEDEIVEKLSVDNLISLNHCLEDERGKLSELQIQVIENLDWYQYDNFYNVIFVKSEELDKIVASDGLEFHPDELVDHPGEYNDIYLRKIDDVFKRYNEIDGFYHA